MIRIRQAEYEDIPRIMKFIDEHWKKDHIFARDRKFFEWQFVENGKVNFYLGIDEEQKKIYGVLGVILYNHSEHPDISGTIWKTIKSDNPILGIEIDRYMFYALQVRYACSAGISEKAKRIYQMLGHKIVLMDHFYRLGDLNEYKIAKIKNKKIPQIENTEYELKKIFSLSEMKAIISEENLKNSIMSKDYDYIEKRYFEHPIYNYDIWKIQNSKRIGEAVLVTREEQVANSKICKIIDYYGDAKLLGKITPALDRLIMEKSYEYVDVYSYGVDRQIYEQAGFISVEENDENIIPNYFHPFEKKNVFLNMLDPQIAGLRLFRGDGDQDRPC